MKLKRILLLLSLIVFAGQQLYAREIINLNKGWRFGKEANLGRTMQEVNLPHTWNTSTTGPTYYGTGNYLKEIVIPEKWSSKRVFIRFYGVSNIANLFINGKYVGEHRGAFTSFTFDITPFLNYGVYNSILVSANNSQQLDVMPISSEKTFYGGIYRDCELIVVDKNHFSLTDYGSDGIYIEQKDVSRDAASVEALVKLDGMPGSTINVTMSVKESANGVSLLTKKEVVRIEANGKARLHIPFEFSNPRLWNGVIDPFMYKVDFSISSSDGSLDNITIPLGLRFFSVDRNKGFLLNGEPYKLNGVIKHQDRSHIGGALRLEHHEEDMNIISEMGATAIRTADAPQHWSVYDLADDHGLIAWVDLPFVAGENQGGKGFIDSYAFKENGDRQLTEMARQLYNHPSIAFWGIYSNLLSKGDNPQQYIRQLNDLAHRESPGRLTVALSIEDGPINFITDVMAWAQYFGWKSGDTEDLKKWTKQFSTDWKELKPGLGEYGAGGNILFQSDSLQKINMQSATHPENYQTHFHEKYIAMIEQAPFLWGSFINSIFDYGIPNAGGEEAKVVSDMGIVSFDRHTRKDAFYMYKALWNDLDPFVYIAERRNNLRAGTLQAIKVYTNMDDAELFVNNISVGKKQPKRGMIEWTGVRMDLGKNIIRVQSGKESDLVDIEIFNDILAQ